MDQLTKMKLKLDIKDNKQDELLNLYLEDAENEILSLTNQESIPNKLLSTQIKLAIIYYNKQGIEGQTGHSEGSISRTFDEDMPSNIKKQILAYRRLARCK